MGYPEPNQLSTRKVSDDVVLSSGGFTILNRFNVGSRMALFKVHNSIVVWSPIPYCPEVKKALATFSRNPSVSHIIVPDNEHCMGVKSFKTEFPDAKIIAGEGALAHGPPVDYRISSQYANQIIDSAKLKEIGVAEAEILENFQFVYLPAAGNKELVTYHKPSKAIFGADMIFNLRADQRMEQFSQQAGFAENFNPFFGWSFLARFLNVDSVIGRILMRRFASVQLSASGLQAIESWDFSSLVMSHGNVFEGDGKVAFRKVFGPHL